MVGPTKSIPHRSVRGAQGGSPRLLLFLVRNADANANAIYRYCHTGHGCGCWEPRRGGRGLEGGGGRGGGGRGWCRQGSGGFTEGKGVRDDCGVCGASGTAAACWNRAGKCDFFSAPRLLKRGWARGGGRGAGGKRGKAGGADDYYECFRTRYEGAVY